MNEPKRRFFAGNTLRQALVLAASHFEIEPEELAYTPIEKRHGFLKSGRRAVIEVDPDNPRRPAGERVPLPPAAGGGAGASGGERAIPEDGGAGGAGAVGAPGTAGGGAVRGERAIPQGGGARTEGGGAAEVRRPFGRGPEPAGRPGGGAPERRHEGGRRGERGGGRGEERGGRRGFRERPRGPRAEPARAREPREDGAPRAYGAERSPAEREAEGLITLPEAPRRTSERFPAATGPVAEAAERGLRHLLEVTGLDLSFHIHQGEGRLEIELSGDDAELCSNEEGELLRAIEHLLPRLIRSLAGEPVPCRVDCDNFHEIWEERLRTLAQQVADEVRRKGRPRTLEPMNPADRRIVHMTLADDPAVETESEGEGYFKRITIRPL